MCVGIDMEAFYHMVDDNNPRTRPTTKTKATHTKCQRTVYELKWMLSLLDRNSRMDGHMMEGSCTNRGVVMRTLRSTPQKLQWFDYFSYKSNCLVNSRRGQIKSVRKPSKEGQKKLNSWVKKFYNTLAVINRIYGGRI